MPEIEIPKYLIKIIPEFIASLEKNYPDHNSLLKFDDAAKTAIKVIKEKTGIEHKIESSDIRRLVKYLLIQGASIGILADGCYWASTSAELSFSLGYISGRKKYYSELLELLSQIDEKKSIMEKV